MRWAGWRWDRWLLVLILLVAWTLRLPPILGDRFHADEAWYGHWGLLIGHGQDPWLIDMPVDKPPLLPYSVAGAQALFGNSELAVRFAGLTTGTTTVALAAALAHSLYRDRWTTTATAIGVALSPFAILFSATAFTDPMMVALGLAACVAATRDRPGWAGGLVGMALAAKQTGLVWLPLVLVLLASSRRYTVANVTSRAVNVSRLAIDVCHLLFAALLVVGLVYLWDRIRVMQGAESFWRTSVTRYGGLRIVWPQELARRMQGWLGLMRYSFASPAINGLLLAGIPALVWRPVARHRYARGSLVDLLLVTFCFAYLLFYWLWAFPVWDRYLLPLVPVLALLLARVLKLLEFWASAINDKLGVVNRGRPCIILYCALSVFLAFPAWSAAHSRYPVGGDHGSYDGIDQVTGFMWDLPEGAVVYHHWLGWHYAYHLFDGPVYLAYWPTPAWLARDVQAFGSKGPRYITFPSWESSVRVEYALTAIGYRLYPVLVTTRRDTTPSFTVYRIEPLSDQ